MGRYSSPESEAFQADQDRNRPDVAAHYEGVRTEDRPVEPSAVQADDLLMLGGAARHGGELAFNLATRAGAAKEAFTHAPALARVFETAGKSAVDQAAGKRLAAGVTADNPLASRGKAAVRAFLDRAPLSAQKDKELGQLAKTMRGDMSSERALNFNDTVRRANDEVAAAKSGLGSSPKLGTATPSGPQAVTSAGRRATGAVELTPTDPAPVYKGAPAPRLPEYTGPAPISVGGHVIPNDPELLASLAEFVKKGFK